MTLFLLIEEYDDLKETVKKGLLKRFWLYNSLLGPDYFLLAAVGRSDYLELDYLYSAFLKVDILTCCAAVKFLPS